MMAGIRSANTRPEMLVRRGLHALGYRYRLHVRQLPGKPDLVFPSRRAVIFVHGCFWHGHGCSLFRWPSTRQEFWRSKIGANIARDGMTRERLIGTGWRVLELWECALRGRDRQPVETVLAACAKFIDGSDMQATIGSSSIVAGTWEA